MNVTSWPLIAVIHHPYLLILVAFACAVAASAWLAGRHN